MTRHRPGRQSNAGPTRPGVFVSPSIVTAALVAAGVALRLWQYFANTSLWLDEAAVARNIVDRSAARLLQPLDYAQVAPPGFLLAEKTVVTALGNSEWALRLFPLLCGLGAVAIFWRVASWTLTGWAVPYAVGLFALGTPLVYFSSHVKQYSTDIASTTAVLGTVVWLRRQPVDMARASIAALAGALTAWFSQPVLFVLIGAGAALLLSTSRTDRARWRAVLVVVLVWALSAGIVGALAWRNVSQADRGYLDWYWTSGFMPFPPGSATEALWAWERLTWLFGKFVTGLRRTNGGLGYPWSPVFAALAVLGVVAFWKRQRDTALILVTPVLIVLTASALHLYPFTGRVISFLLPIVLLATAAGADYALNNWPHGLRVLSPALLGVVVGSPLYATAVALPPERTEHLRPVLEKLANRWQAADDVYVYYGAGQSFMYYAPRLRLYPTRFVLGQCSSSDLRVYLREMDAYRGRPRLWIVATHAASGATDLLMIFRYLDTIGRRLDTIEERATLNLPSIAAYALLFDLSDASRLRLASAETYPIPDVPRDEGAVRWGCYGTQAARGGR